MTKGDPGSVHWQIVAGLAATPVSTTWRVAIGERCAVLRQDEPAAALLGLDRRAEPEVLRAAAAAGLGPACLMADPARGLLLTEWLPGRALAAVELRSPANLARAARLLRRLHTTPFAGRRVDLGEALDRYARAAGDSGAGLATTARQQLAVCLAAPTDAPCFCHNDPTPGNFILAPGGDLQLIDWEYAGLGHPEFDLAGLALGAGLMSTQLTVFLTAYRGRPPTRDESRRHREWEALCGSLGALWTAACRVKKAP